MQNGGHCHPYAYGPNPAIAKFELETHNFLKHFVREHNIPCDWTSFTGVHAYLTEDTFAAATAAVENLEQRHPDLAAKVDLVTPSGSKKSGETLESLRVPTAKGAVVQLNAASLWPYKLVAWVLEQLLDRFPAPGFNLQTNTPVTGLRRQEQSSSSGSNPSGGGWVLTTPRGRITASTVLLCTNAYTSRLLPGFSDLIVPTRGQAAALIPPKTAATGGADEDLPVKLDHSYVFVGNYPEPVSVRDEYLAQRPLPGGELIFGGGRNYAWGHGIGEWRDDVIEQPVSKWLRGQLSPPLNLQPVGAEEPGYNLFLDPTFQWTGIMGYSRDGHPWVGAVPESLGGSGASGGLWVCGGYSGHGMPVTVLSARAVVEMMGGGSGDVPGAAPLPEEFRLTEERVRQARGRFEEVAKAHAGSFSMLFPRSL